MEHGLASAEPAQDTEALCWTAMLAELKVEEHRVGAGHWAHLATILQPLRGKEVSHLPDCWRRVLGTFRS